MGKGISTPPFKHQTARVVMAAGDYTTTSGIFVDVDGVNVSITMSTGANRVLIGFIGSIRHSLPDYIQLDVTVDGIREGQAKGLVNRPLQVANVEFPIGFIHLTDVLTAGSHTFKLQWRTGAATATLQASSLEVPLVFFAVEVK